MIECLALNKKMKIAIFHNLRKGGARRTLIELAKRLAKNHVIDVFSLDPETKNDFKFARETKIFSFSLSRNFLIAQKQIVLELPKIHKKISKLINRGKYDIAYVNHDIFTKAPYILRYLEIPTIYFCHEPPREFYEPFSLFSSNLKFKIINCLRYHLKYIDRENVEAADILITNSKYSNKYIAKIYGKTTVRLRLGVDTSRFKYFRRKRSNFYLTVGALAFFKGYDFLIRSIAMLPQRYKYPLVSIASGGRETNDIKKLANRLNVELRIIDSVTDNKLVDYYNRARLCLLAPYFEPFGLITLEAMSCGLPVVGVAEGGLIETIPEKNGWLSERDPDKFSKTILKALDNNLSESKSLTLRNYVQKKWNWDVSVRQLEKIFREVYDNESCDYKRKISQ